MRKNMRRPTVTPHRCHDRQRIRKPCMADSDKYRPVIRHDVAPHCRKYTRHPAGKCLELLALKSGQVKLLSNSSQELRFSTQRTAARRLRHGPADGVEERVELAKTCCG